MKRLRRAVQTLSPSKAADIATPTPRPIKPEDTNVGIVEVAGRRRLAAFRAAAILQSHSQGLPYTYMPLKEPKSFRVLHLFRQTNDVESSEGTFLVI